MKHIFFEQNLPFPDWSNKKVAQNYVLTTKMSLSDKTTPRNIFLVSIFFSKNANFQALK